MKQKYIHKALALVAIVSGLLLPSSMAKAEGEDTLFVYKTDGSMMAFPAQYITSQDNAGGQLRISVLGGETYTFNQGDLSTTSHTAPEGRPTMTSFKFNNKFNDQLYTEAVGNIAGSTITADVGAIGKWLVPSFNTSADDAKVYIGDVEQTSKVTRNKFDRDLVYTVALPGAQVLRPIQRQESEPGNTPEPYLSQELSLTANQFSSNLPGKSGEEFAEMIDKNPATCFHSTWDVPTQQEKEQIYNTWPYIVVALNEPLDKIKFGYTTRNQDSYAPLGFTLEASNDNQNWMPVATLSTADGLPTTASTPFTSAVIDLGGTYQYLRFTLTAAQHRRYLVFAEFNLYKVSDNPDYQQPGTTADPDATYAMQPYGTDYQVHVNWLTDAPNAVPRIDINIDGGVIVENKEDYLRAEIIIDGKGAYPSMTDSVNIRGRGNTSWQNPGVYKENGEYIVYHNPKNPYRLKFDSKRKPLGMKNGKNWVLLANKQDGSMMSNAIGMKIADVVGTAAANHVMPVELYINGEYRGSYNLTEQVGVSNNSIDLDDETACALLELDTYFDETYKFYSNTYSLPVNVKFPDFAEDSTHLTLPAIQEDFNHFAIQLHDGIGIEDLVDVDYLAKYLFVNDLVLNYEIKHPKSTYLYKESYATGKYIFGPVWDLDWAWGYEVNKKYCTTGATNDFYNTQKMEANAFIHDLRFASKAVDKAFYQICKDFKENHLQEVLDYCDAYYNYAKPSFEHNAEMWNDGQQYATVTSNMKNWITQRLNYLYDNITHYDDTPVVPSGITDTETTEHIPTFVDVYTLQGIRVKTHVPYGEFRQGLQPGIYIVNGKKMVVR